MFDTTTGAKPYRWLVVIALTVLLGGGAWVICCRYFTPLQTIVAQDRVPAPGGSSTPSALEPVAMMELAGAAPVTYTTSSHMFAARLLLTLPAETLKGELSVSTAMLTQTLGGNSIPLLVSSGGAKGPGQAASFEVGPANRVVEIHLKATLGAPGDYTGALVLRQGTAIPQAKTIVVKYTHADLPLTVSEARMLPGACLPCMNLQQALSVTVTGPPGGSAFAVMPTVASLKVSSESTQAAVGAVYRSVTFYEPGTAASAPATSTFQVKPGLPTEMGFAFDGIEGPGSYAGKLQFSAQGYKLISTDFNFAVRYSWIVALLMVTLGAAVITLIRRAVVDIQPRLVVRAAVARLLSGHDSLKTQLQPLDNELVILTSIRSRIVAEREKAEQSQPPTESAMADSSMVLKNEDQKLRSFADWVNAKRALAVASQALPSAKVLEFRATVEATATALAKAGPLAADIADKLPALRMSIEDSWRDSLSVPISELNRQIGEARKNAKGAADRKFEAADQSAVEASKLLSAYRFEEFRVSFDRASVFFTQARGNQLLDLIPQGATGVDWDRVRTALQDLAEADDPRDAEAHYEQAQAAYRRVTVPSDGIPNLEADVALLALDTNPPTVSTRVLPSRIHYPLDAPRESAVALRYQVRNINAWVDLAAVVTTGLFGVVVVWLGDRDWGTASDITAAFLWGMGLHTIGTATATNVTAMLARVRT